MKIVIIIVFLAQRVTLREAGAAAPPFPHHEVCSSSVKLNHCSPPGDSDINNVMLLTASNIENIVL
ncbi:TPA: hypothetical protein ACXNPR_001780 [Enterobacter cancerogenus]